MARVLWVLYLTANQRRVIAEGLGVTDAQAREIVAFWAGLHDLGKITPCFQRQHEVSFRLLQARGDYPPAAADARLPHALASQLAVVNPLLTTGYSIEDPIWTSVPVYRVAQILGGHHGRFQRADKKTCTQPEQRAPDLGFGDWARQRALALRLLHEATGGPLAAPRVTAPAAVLVTGLVILADWLASQERFLIDRQLRGGDQRSLGSHLATTERLAPALLAGAGLMRPPTTEFAFEQSFGFSPNPLQRSVLDELPAALNGPGLLLVTAATGDGKTEAALAALRLMGKACGTEGMFFALPTMATSNQMYGRVRRFLSATPQAAGPLTLLHSMAWLTSEYVATPALEGDEQITSTDADTRTAASDWLRGPKRGLLAPFAVGTVDQILLAALTTKHNALRQLGLAGKVVVVDEAHAYDAYMQALLQRLLSWLGAFGCPVVLLSATLPVSTARGLVAAYLAGAGHDKVDELSAIDYPGWVYADAGSGTLTSVSEPARAALAEHRATSVRIDVRPVWRVGSGIGLDGSVSDTEGDERLAAIREELSPLVAGSGRAAVVCNTVADAQRTFAYLRDWFSTRGEDAPTLRLLHSRFTARARDAITATVTAELGKEGPRPRRMVLVGTQVIEQSLDLDVDLMISDLAPIALLLQRVGRCWRHELVWSRGWRPGNGERPAWSRGPRLVVLSRTEDGEQVTPPKHWGSVYDPYLLQATHSQLSARAGRPIAIPSDVQPLVEAVYGPVVADPFTLDDRLLTLQANEAASASAANLVAIPRPSAVTDLEALSIQDLTDLDTRARLGADSARVVCCHLDAAGVPFLDATHEQPLPVGVEGRGGKIHFSVEDVRAVLAETAPIPATWLKGENGLLDPPPTWADNPWLRDLHLLPRSHTNGAPARRGRSLGYAESFGVVRGI